MLDIQLQVECSFQVRRAQERRTIVRFILPWSCRFNRPALTSIFYILFKPTFGKLASALDLIGYNQGNLLISQLILTPKTRREFKQLTSRQVGFQHNNQLGCLPLQHRKHLDSSSGAAKGDPCRRQVHSPDLTADWPIEEQFNRLRSFISYAAATRRP